MKSTVNLYGGLTSVITDFYLILSNHVHHPQSSVDFLKLARKDIANLDTKDRISDSQRRLGEIALLLKIQMPDIERKGRLEDRILSDSPLKETAQEKVSKAMK